MLQYLSAIEAVIVPIPPKLDRGVDGPWERAERETVMADEEVLFIQQLKRLLL